MDDVTLRNYIATTAAIVDNTHPGNILDATTAEWLVGNMGDDTVVGTAADDILFGAGGSDLLVGGAGHDIIDADDDYTPGALTGVTVTRRHRGHPHELLFSSADQITYAADVGAGDEIHAGSGDDIVTAQYGDDTVFGDNGDDTIAGDAGSDSLFGGNGNDRIAGDWYGTNDTLHTGGSDYIDGGPGQDIINGEAGADVLIGGDGSDHLYGFIDTVFVGAPNEDPSSDEGDYLSGGRGIDVLVGHGNDDTLIGGDDDDNIFGDSDDTPVPLQGDDYLDGGAGNDRLRGYGGNDEIIGGAGNDIVQADAGDDVIDGGEHNDLLYGQAGNDDIVGGRGVDSILGGDGNDRIADEMGGIDAHGTPSDNFIWGEAGDDVLIGKGYVDGGDGNDEITGTGWLLGQAGDDEITGGVDADRIAGGEGADTARGGANADVLWGQAQGDVLHGDEGNDQIVGGVGDDDLHGDEGDDQLWGEDGVDTLNGGVGRDLLMGGAGNDIYLIDGASGEDFIVDDEGQNTIRFAEDVTADQLRYRRGVDASGDDQYLVIEGAATFSRVVIKNGMNGAIARHEFADGSFLTHAQVVSLLATQAAPNNKPLGPTRPLTVYGSTLGESLVGLSGNDTVHAGQGNDVVSGGAGNDTLTGFEGADRLDGGIGNDVLIGGAGNDSYIFGRTHGRDTIVEQFDSASGVTEHDMLELASGVLPADVTLHQHGNDLIVGVRQTEAQLRVQGYFVTQTTVTGPGSGQTSTIPSDRRIEEIRFADGTVWNAQAIASRIQSGTPNSMTGTAANDTHTVDHVDDTVTEAANGGNDLIRSSISYALRPNVESLTLTGFLDTNAWSTPSNAVSYLSGNAANNVFNGPGTWYVAGGGTANTSTGGGIMGYAVMSGGAGDDTYHLDEATGGQVIEVAGEGRDTIVLHGSGWATYQLPDHVEALTSVDGVVTVLTFTRGRFGNALDNYIEGAKVGPFSGLPANIIDGGVGSDTMVGFQGDDVFIVDNPGDIVIENGVLGDGSQRSTADEVRASVAYELPDNVDILTLTGSLAINGWGNDLANVLDGSQNVAINHLHGGLGNDYYKVNANDVVIERPAEGIDTIEWIGTGERTYTPADLLPNVEALQIGHDAGDADYQGDARNDRVTGNAGSNHLFGAEGDDWLTGGDGDDWLEGGAGNDFLVPGQGNDTFAFSRGFGQDALQTTNVDRIVFDATITFDDLVFTPETIRIAHTSDELSLTSKDVEIRFADGTFLTGAEVFARMDASDSTVPSAGGDTLTGTSGNDTLDALAGNDFLYGLAGNDTLIGGTHDDDIRAGDGNDALRGDAGRDTLYGNAGDDDLHGGDGNDTLDGGSGRDQLDGGLGDDTVRGGYDDDVIAGGGGSDYLYGGAGNDTITMGASTGGAAGEAGDDTLIGGASYESLSGGDGNDRIDGGGDGDSLFGDAGIDTFVLKAGGGYDYIDDGLSGELTIVDVDASYTPADITLSRTFDGIGSTLFVTAGAGTDVFEMRGFGTTSAPLEIRFADGTVWTQAMIMDVVARIDGTMGDDVISGTPLDDRIYGLDGADTITGLDGNDVLDGGTGADYLEGGLGDDRYVIGDVGDTVVELYGEGTDAVETPFSTTLAADLENLTLLGGAINAIGNSHDNILTGNALANTLDGKYGNDTMIGGAGNDSYFVDFTGDVVVENAAEGVDAVSSNVTYTLAANVENLTLTGSSAIHGSGNAAANTLRGNAAANTLNGFDGNDTLDGAGGADQLIGGNGDDTYTVDHASDVITEAAGEGLDRVNASASHTLSGEVEHLTLTGTGAINATGNALANQLTGNSGANVLDGKAGNDTLRGNAGNDTYVIDSLADTLIENAGEGTDTVQSALAFTLAANFENLTLTGTAATNGAGNVLANTIVGNTAANVLDGGTGNDTLRGGAGHDTYTVDATGDVVTENSGEGTDHVNASASFTLAANVENLTLTGTGAINGTGNALANTLTGNAANNTLSGGTGADTMIGGAGNDTYVVDATSDIVSESAGGGTDSVQSSIAWSLAANVENLTLTGTGAINGTGNALANVLTGNTGNNVLDASTGADTMAGGAGNDTYVVDNTSDSVTEAVSAGTDVVQSSITYTLAANVENLTLTGAASINGTGNALANTLQGNAGANTLDGGAGADTQRGGAGNDVLIVDNSADVVVENASEGDDTVQSSVSWTLGANFENLTLAGAAAIDATGNTLDNWLRGNAAVNTLTGGDGQDLLFGAAGNDSLAGGNGRDILQGGDGDDTLSDTAGSNLLHGGLGIDTLTGAAGNELFIGGAGNDTITAGTGADLIAFNRGDGQDVVNASAAADDTLSLGGGIRYADVALRKSGNDLVVDVGASEQVTFKDWYAAPANPQVVNLQMIVDASTDWTAGSTDALRNKRIARFDFAGLVAQFDAARTANPGLTTWAVASALASEHLGGSDTAALGGDLGYQYGRASALTGIGWTPVDGVLANAAFGTGLQTLQAPGVLFSGTKTLA
ncbi:MAG TPA: calcium-binding protein [Casimicrobiaceae bacterium]|nr:calcium-binding protein [Casimicrobiaceae bacterium]